MNIIKKLISILFLFSFSLAVYAIDWSQVKAKQITLFYPGQASWEWILTKSDHGGAKNFRAGKDCRECHQDEEKDMGMLIVSGKKLEPNPVPGKRGFVDVAVKTAYDDNNFYLQLSWKESDEVAKTKIAKDQTRITLLFDDGHVSEIKRGGCWGACHDDSSHMPSANQANNTNLYLSKSRSKITRKGGGENYKSSEEIKQLLADGFFAEYWQAKLNKDKLAVAADGYLLDKRYANESPITKVDAELKNGVWTVEFNRKLVPDIPLHKNIVSGNFYSFGLAIHDAYSQGRFHNISFLHTFALDQGKADFIAVKQ
jgi:cytochrome c-type protein NapC